MWKGICLSFWSKPALLAVFRLIKEILPNA